MQALIVSPDCRLAPEHKLPAAIDDAHIALRWLKEEALSEDTDMWLRDGVDFDRVFILGDSSGGNTAHHLAVRLGAGSKELAPVRVRGYVLLAPFFGGIVRTKSEEETPCEAFWNLEMYNRFWRLSIPDGATLDHPFVNPFGPLSPCLKGVALDPILAVVGGGEILKDRVEDYARRLKELGKKIEYVEFEGKQHALVVTPDYRLAPKHKLPAAIDDAHNALKWLKEEALSENTDMWLHDGVDFDRVFILGDSFGGNMAHHLVVRLGTSSKELAPIRVRGYVLLAPFFGGIVKTKFWRLSIPDGATLDHPFVNPFGPLSPRLKWVALDLILVVVGGGEILKDRVENYARRLKEMGKKIEYVEFEGKQHGFFTDHSFSEEAKVLMQIIKGFMFGMN
ncbi:hypothetical protein F0562_017334 [Nyssa sinensis]|uniref:Alpha/beta hydrolase fold-3 domain-containing protein n=1 Tax=Nyssa sinensis TaxID=561372 RepID=A0A5J4ZH60_9ASTE|nr:hypothetical protein F0562_017334 [Nyssa sinensis]